MKTVLKVHILVLILLGAAAGAQAQGTAFTYHGILNRNRTPVTGEYDMRFAVYDVEIGGAPVAGPLPKNAVGVTNGLFTVRIDFTSGVFTGPPRWIEVSVRPAGNGNFETLSPRQELTSSPYSIRALTAGTATDVSNGSVVKSLNSLRDNVTLEAGANVTIAPSGNTLRISSTGPGGNIWSLNGADTYYNAGKVGIGTDTPITRLTVAGAGGFNSATAASIILDNTAAGRRWQWHALDDGRLQLADFNTAATRMIITTGGNVGIGALAPTSRLEIEGQDALGLIGFQPFLTLKDVNAGNARGIIQSVDGGLNLFTESYLSGANPFAYIRLDNNGNVGLGTASPSTKLDVVGDIRGTRLVLRADPLAPANAVVLCEDPNVANFVPFNTATGRPLNVIARDATVRQLTITGGADLAEPFAMSHQGVLPGCVVVIDEKSPGSLRLSTQAYDRRVAGVVSGANGIKPGISLHQEGAIEGGENVALSGRVYVQGDATFGAIKPGDLLTTSDTPGHAMKVTDHGKAQGAILGKAMSGLQEGQGMVLVLVTLQ